MGMCLFNLGMKICPEIRCENANTLAKEAGSQGAFAERLGISQPQASALLTGKKQIGHTLARNIEEAFEKERGWLDHEHKAVGALDAPESVRGMVSSLLEQDAAVQEFFLDVYWAAKAMADKRAGRALIPSPIRVVSPDEIIPANAPRTTSPKKRKQQ